MVGCFKSSAFASLLPVHQDRSETCITRPPRVDRTTRRLLGLVLETKTQHHTLRSINCVQLITGVDLRDASWCRRTRFSRALPRDNIGQVVHSSTSAMISAWKVRRRTWRRVQCTVSYDKLPVCQRRIYSTRSTAPTFTGFNLATVYTHRRHDNSVT